MVTKTAANEFSQSFPLWYYERSPEACVRSARSAGRRRRKQVDGEPRVRIRNGKVMLTWPQPVAEAAA